MKKLFVFFISLMFILCLAGCSSTNEKINAQILYKNEVHNLKVSKGSKLNFDDLNFISNKDDAILFYGDNFKIKYDNESLDKDIIMLACDYNGTEKLGNMYTLQEAYEANYINKDDLNSIYNNYLNHNNELILDQRVELKILNDRLVSLKDTNKDAKLKDVSVCGYYGNYDNLYVVRISDAFTDYPADIEELKIGDTVFQYSGPSFLVWVQGLPLNEEIALNIKTSYISTFCKKETGLDEITIEVYYGCYNGCYAVLIDELNKGDTGVIRKVVIEDLVFNYPYGNREIMVWKEGKFYTLPEAYENKLLQKDDLIKIYQLLNPNTKY